MSDLVSVIVPVYKVEDLLERCVDSILDQTYQNLQVILVDDGSPDRCGAMCDAYAARDSRVEVIHQQNSGLSAARNAGLARARGDFVTFVDSDDWLDLTMIDHLMCGIREGADIAVCGHQKVDTEEDISPVDSSESAWIFLTSAEALGELHGPGYVGMVVAWGKLFRRHLFADVTFPVDRYHEDEFTTHRLLHLAEGVAVTPAPLYHYWQRGGSITASYSATKRQDARDALRERAGFLRDAGLLELAVVAYRKLLWVCIKDRRRMAAHGDRDAIRVMDRDLRAIRSEARSVPDSWRSRAFYEAYATVPWVFDALAARRDRSR